MSISSSVPTVMRSASWRRLRGKVADEHIAFGQGGSDGGLVDAGAPGEDEVRRGWRDLVAELLERADEARACRADAGDVGSHVREVGERGFGGELGESVHVVGVAHRAHAGEELGMAEGEAGAHARQRERLGQGTQDDDVREPADERHGILVGEVDVGLVHHEDTGDGEGEGFDLRPRDRGPGG